MPQKPTNPSVMKTVLRVTIVNSSINTLLALFKIIIGYFGHSQALIADGIHSFSDLITDLLVLIAARMGGQLPDKEHPYGHRRIETIAAIIISIVLILVAFGIAYDTIHHLLNSALRQRPNFPVIIVAIVSVIANEGLFRYTFSQGNKINSDLLRVNAWHNRSDALVSIIVLVSVVGTMLGISSLDAIGALIIALLILRMGLKMIWNSIQELIDRAVDEKTLEEITQAIENVPGVISIHQLRTRSHGGDIFIDVHIQVPPNISVSEGHYIGEQVHLALVKQCKQVSDVTVHIDPENDETNKSSVQLPNRETILSLLKNRWQSLPGFSDIQRTQLHYLNGKLDIDAYLAYDATKTIDDLQARYQAAVDDIDTIRNVTIYWITIPKKR